MLIAHVRLNHNFHDFGRAGGSLCRQFVASVDKHRSITPYSASTTAAQRRTFTMPIPPALLTPDLV